MEDERNYERTKAEERVRLLDQEKDKLEHAIEREQEERERHLEMERRRQFENEVI